MSSTPVRLKATPYKPGASEEGAGLPLDYANFPFEFVHYPSGWEFVEGFGFLPSLSEIQAVPGVNGVDKSLSTAKARAGAMKKGGTIIEPGDRRLGEYADYVVSYPVERGNKHFCFLGTTFRPLPGGKFLPVPKPELLHAFRKLLVDKGVVAPMIDAVYSKLLEVENRGYTQLAKRRAPQADLDKKLARLTAMKAEWERLTQGQASDEDEEKAPAVALVPTSETKRIKSAAKEASNAAG